MQKIFIYILFFIISTTVFARRTTVTTASAIKNGSWTAGDTIVMQNGNWTNQAISLTANGNALNPIVLQAETEGSVILNGTSRLSIGGSYIVVSGLYFLNGTLITGNAVVEFRNGVNANNCTLKNTAIVNYNPADNTVDSKWVSLYGLNNTVDHCSFENKTNSGTLLVVWLTSGVTVNHVISNNYFGYRNANFDTNGNELNGQEIIRIGDSSTSMTTANVTVSGNFFEKCNGEIEVISNKSCGNLYTNNLFLECKGMLTLRHGNGCTVDGNYFFGNGVSESGGVRIIGENHKVYNNYFENLRGTNYRAALCMVRGKENSALSEYYQVKNALVAFNTMVNCSQSFCINYNSSSSLTLPPINSVIAHNHVYNSSTSNYNVIIDQNYVSAMSITWKNNLMNQGKYSNFAYTSTQVITGKDAKMTLAGTPINMYEPGTASALLNYTTDEYPEVTSDIRGRERPTTAKVPGASQNSVTISEIMPAKTTVGAGFFNNPTAEFEAVNELKLMNYKLINRELIIETSRPGNIHLYDLSGIIISESKITVGNTYTKQLQKGIYVLRFMADEGSWFSHKLIVL
ncbi:MAG: chondroitinase-B domain-containing protein [Paludibacter sp.]